MSVYIYIHVYFYIQPQELKSCFKNFPFPYTIAGPQQVDVFTPLKKLSFWFCKFLIVPKKITQASLCSPDFSQHVLSNVFELSIQNKQVHWPIF